MTDLAQIRFADTPDQELRDLSTSLELANIAEQLEQGGALPDKVRSTILDILRTFQDIFNADYPAVDIDLTDVVIKSGRDLAISRVLRERALFRLFNILYLNAEGPPVYLGHTNPLTGETFKRQEDFLGWFCQEAHVSRSLVFGRMKIIRRLRSLGISPQQAYQLCLTKYTAVEKTLDWIADWDKDMITTVDPGILDQVVDSLEDDLPEERIHEIRRISGDLLADPEEIREAAIPIFRQLLEQVGEQGSVQDATDYVRHEVLGKPEVHYRWDAATQSLLVDYIQKAIDESGVEYITNVATYAFSPDVPEILPTAVVADLVTRLPIRNRKNLDI